MQAGGADGQGQVGVGAGQQGQAALAGDGGQAATAVDGVGGAEGAIDDADLGGQGPKNGLGIGDAIRIGEEQQAGQGLGRGASRA